MTEFESRPVVPVQTFGPGTYTQTFAIQGNSVLSSLFIYSMDAGSSVKVNYWDSGAGGDLSERYNLQSHPLLTGVSTYTDRQTISRIHNKPNIEIVVTGGNVKLGIYVTVVSAFATDSGAALIANDQPLSEADRGTPVVVLDPATGTWQFASGVNGVQNVSIDNAISTTDLLVSGNQFGETPDSVGLSPGSSMRLISFSPSATLKVPNIVIGGGSRGFFELKINGTLWGRARSTYTSPQASFQIGTITLSSGDTLTVDVTNESESGDAASYYAFAYTGT